MIKESSESSRDANATTERMAAVVNWFEELKRLVPTR
jgi:hypothetical protein